MGVKNKLVKFWESPASGS